MTPAALIAAAERALVARPPPGLTVPDLRGVLDRHRARLVALAGAALSSVLLPANVGREWIITLNLCLGRDSLAMLGQLVEGRLVAEGRVLSPEDSDAVVFSHPGAAWAHTLALPVLAMATAGWTGPRANGEASDGGAVQGAGRLVGDLDRGGAGLDVSASLHGRSMDGVGQVEGGVVRPGSARLDPDTLGLAVGLVGVGDGASPDVGAGLHGLSVDGVGQVEGGVVRPGSARLDPDPCAPGAAGGGGGAVASLDVGAGLHGSLQRSVGESEDPGPGGSEAAGLDVGAGLHGVLLGFVGKEPCGLAHLSLQDPCQRRPVGHRRWSVCARDPRPERRWWDTSRDMSLPGRPRPRACHP